MKKYILTTIYHNGAEYTWPSYKQLKRSNDNLERLKTNRLVKTIVRETQEFGEYEHAGEYKVTKEIVYENPETQD